MKNHLITRKQRLAAIIFGFLSGIQTVNAATYDLQDQQSSFDSPEPFLPFDPSPSSSILESLQQAETDLNKNQYLDVLNLLKQNKVEEADKKLAQLVQDNPNVAAFHNLQALLYLIKKDNEAAAKSYQKAINLAPQSILAYLGMAILKLDQNQLDQAEVYANKAININDKAIKAYFVLADVALKQKNTDEVEKTLLTALEKANGDVNAEAEVVKNLGKFYLTQKQPEKILALSEDLNRRYPDNKTVLSLLAGAQLVNNKLEPGQQTLLRIIDQDPKDINHRLLLAKLLGAQPGKEKETLDLMTETAKIDTNNPQANFLKGAYLIKLRRTGEALELAKQLDSQFPKLPLGKILQGDAYLADKKLDQATTAYQKAYQLQTNDKILALIADLLNAQNKSDDALKLLNSELAKNPENMTAHFKLATTYQQQNDYSKAEQHYQAVLKQQPDNPLALNNLAWLYSQQKNPKALELAKKAYEKASASAAIADTYGYILLKQGQPTKSLDLLEKAASLAPKANDIQYHLAEAQVANGNKQKAVKILETITTAESDFTEKKAAAALLDQLKTQ
ncbi:MAG: hypothetical protein CVV13_12570 [Gammaproteobacteria bacterium HGW-Gammaproteobacteria-3]|nr:MAG: hypothetical protein CVV13_12570 [Gammaproteobacteria bacterium HGW-Gammaproteobacteria-3]